MDINSIRGKLATLQKPKGEKKEKIDFSLYVWKPKKAGKYQIRILDSVYDKKNPFQEVFVHYGISKFPIYALTNWNEKDPIVEFAKELRSGDFDKENWQLANKLSPKMRIFAPIIVRGEEDMGVRLWEFGKEIYSTLLAIAEDEDYGDFTDVNEGRDFTLEAVNGEVGGRQGLKTSILVKPKTSPLSKDSKQVKKWLSEQPNILELQTRYKYTFEKLKEVLANFLTPSEEVEESSSNEEKVVNEEPKKSKSPKSISKSEKFDELFEKEENDDLPFKE